ncbi:MAG TPA: PilZ domain-containing protein [Vicinamibacteria bacterium]|jgi:hypothetical protein|nr:PilZ domain-containing protein [Vicinamibacteria bacterium]
MFALETGLGGYGGTEPEEPIRVWIERGDGSITRGLVGVLSEDGASIQLTGPALVAAGDDVSVRIAVSRDSPTLGTVARVLSVRSSGAVPECELEWTHSGIERGALAALIASLS